MSLGRQLVQKCQNITNLTKQKLNVLTNINNMPHNKKCIDMHFILYPIKPQKNYSLPFMLKIFLPILRLHGKMWSQSHPITPSWDTHYSCNATGD